jgi:DNA-binding transcriptional LysR family regulator
VKRIPSRPASERQTSFSAMFQVLMQEGSVTKAAAKLRITQSSASSALGRLRDQLGDPLFTRTQGGVEPTQRAEAMYETISRALDDIDRATWDDVRFDPKFSSQRFRIMVTDHALARFTPIFADILTNDSPSISFEISSVGPDSDYDRLRSGAADVLISYLVSSPPPSFKFQKLFVERLVIIAAKDHPVIQSRLTLEDYLAADHVVVVPRGGWLAGPIDQVLAERGLERKVRMTIPHYLGVPSTVANSHVIGAVPESIADQYLSVLPIRKWDPPIETKPFIVSMVWHERKHSDAGHRWMRGRIREAAKRL